MITLLNSGKTITFNCYYLEFIARVWAEEQAQAIWTGPRLVTLDSWQIANDFITRFKFLEERSPAWESMICMAKRERESECNINIIFKPEIEKIELQR